MNKINICKKCKKYTMEETCPICNEKTIWAIPPKFSLDDKYESIRRKIRAEERKRKKKEQ